MSAGVCAHALRIWVPLGGSEARPWDVRYLPRELPCTLDGPHKEHRATGGRSWR